MRDSDSCLESDRWHSQESRGCCARPAARRTEASCSVAAPASAIPGDLLRACAHLTPKGRPCSRFRRRPPSVAKHRWQPIRHAGLDAFKCACGVVRIPRMPHPQGGDYERWLRVVGGEIVVDGYAALSHQDGGGA